MSEPTRASLLLRVKNPADVAAWEEFHTLYAPLLYRFARARGLSHEDAEDVRAHCWEAIVQQIGSLDYDPRRGSFKGWLRTMVTRRVTDLWRKRKDQHADSHVLGALPDPGPTPAEAFEEEWKRQHLAYALERARAGARTEDVQAFELLLAGTPVTDVAARLAMSVNQVYKAKSTILKAVREVMATLYSEVEL